MVARSFSERRVAGGGWRSRLQRAASAQSGATHKSKRPGVTSQRTRDENQPPHLRPLRRSIKFAPAANIFTHNGEPKAQVGGIAYPGLETACGGECHAATTRGDEGDVEGHRHTRRLHRQHRLPRPEGQGGYWGGDAQVDPEDRPRDGLHLRFRSCAPGRPAPSPSCLETSPIPTSPSSPGRSN
jgi:hypothetical protein